MEVVQYRDFSRGIRKYIGKRVDIVGRDGLLGKLYPPDFEELSDASCQTGNGLANAIECELSDRKEIFEDLKKELHTPICQTESEIDKHEFLKLSGEHPLDLNEYIDESTGELKKFKCDFCGTDKTLIKMNPDGNNICLNCSPSIPAFVSYKKLTEYTLKAKTVGQKMHNQTVFSKEVKAIPKPVKKKKK